MDELSMEFSDLSEANSPNLKEEMCSEPDKEVFDNSQLQILPKYSQRVALNVNWEPPHKLNTSDLEHVKCTSAGLVWDKHYEYQTEISRLKHELQLKDSELKRLSIVREYSEKTHDSTFHLAFLFASPLVRKVGQKLENIMKLDYRKEIMGIESALKDVKHEVRYKVDVATISNFRSVIADAPFALHFTGHGVQNNIESLGASYRLFKEKGNILLLEDENWMTEYLFEDDLKRLVEISRANRSFTYNYEVVFVSSCHSEFAGNVFLASGAHHVIWIMKSETILDKASLRFSKVFYQTLFMKRYSICEAFHIAKEDIRTFFTPSEANKYILLVNKKSEMKGKRKKKLEHKCYPISKFNEGGLTKEESQVFFSKIPPKDDHFIGRQQEICEVLSLLNQNRLVNVLGPPGIGKTALAREIWNHLKDRRIFDDGIIYVPLRGWESAQMFLMRFSLAIQANAELMGIELKNLERQTSLTESPNNDKLIMDEKNQRKIMKFMAGMIRNRKSEKSMDKYTVLLVLDNCEEPLQDDWDQFVNHLDYFLEECPNLKMLLTSRKFMNKLENTKEVPYHLYSLAPQTSIQLLFKKVNRKISESEIKSLLAYSIPDDHPINEHYPIIPTEQSTLLTHPFMLLLGGHPQAIALASSMLEFQTLTEFFEKLLGSNIMDALDLQGPKSYTSLRISLEISVRHLAENNPQALDLYKLLGLLPGGIKQTDLSEIYSNSEWKPFKDQLVKASLCVFKPNEDVLTLLPFMSARAFELLEMEETKMVEYHLKWCCFYKQFWSKFLEKLNKNEVQLNELVEREANIWAWIYRGINRNKYSDDYDTEFDLAYGKNL
jgi:hypothetical protein